MKNKIQKTYRTKHFNVVSNPQHGVCLLFDRKGLGLYQSRNHRHYSLVMKDSFTDTLDKMFLSFQRHVNNLRTVPIKNKIKYISPQKTPITRTMGF